MLQIRDANESDLPRIDEIFEMCRKFMAENGNPTQWTQGFPNSSQVAPEIAKRRAFVVFNDSNPDKVLGVFTLGSYEPAYDKLEGTWSSNDAYVVVHRLAGEQGHGIGKFVFKHVMDKYPYIRIDTHKNNKPMLGLMDKLGFKYCGTVQYVRPGGDGERVAYDYHR